MESGLRKRPDIARQHGNPADHRFGSDQSESLGNGRGRQQYLCAGQYLFDLVRGIENRDVREFPEGGQRPGVGSPTRGGERVMWETPREFEKNFDALRNGRFCQRDAASVERTKRRKRPVAVNWKMQQLRVYAAMLTQILEAVFADGDRCSGLAQQSVTHGVDLLGPRPERQIMMTVDDVDRPVSSDRESAP